MSILDRFERFGARIRGEGPTREKTIFIPERVEAFSSSNREYSSDTTNYYARTFASMGLSWDDALVNKKGYEIYDKMLENDAQIANAYHLKKYMRLVHGWDIRPFEEGDQESEEIAKFVKWNMTEFLEGSVSDFLNKMWDAMRLGYKIAEIIWEPIPYGEYKGKIGVKRFKVRKSHNYRFDCDSHGNLKKRGLLEGSGTFANFKRLPVDKFVIFSWGGLDDDGVSLYGRSEFRVAYRYFAANDFIHTKWLRRLEDISNPCPVGEISSEHPYTDAQRDEIAKEMARLNHMASYVAPAGLKIGMWPTGFGDVSGGKTSETGFVEALNWNSQMASKALLVGSLVQQEGKVSGSYALGKIHFDALIHCLEQLRRVTEDQLMREQVIRRLVRMNYPTEKFPRFHMPSLLEEDPEPRAKVIEILIGAGVINPAEPWIRDYAGVPSNLSWKAKPNENIAPAPKIETKAGVTQPSDVQAAIKPAVDQAKRQVVDQNKEEVTVNPRKLRKIAKRYFLEQFVEGVNERVHPDNPGNPNWSSIMKGVQRYGIGVMPLPNAPVPMDIYVHVGEAAERYAHCLAGVYKIQLEQDCQDARRRRKFRKLDRDQRNDTINKIGVEAFGKADIEGCLLKFGEYFRGTQFEEPGGE